MSSGELITLMNSNPHALPLFFDKAINVHEGGEIPKFGIIKDG